VHDVHGRPSLAFALAHLSMGPTEPTCIGVFREVQKPTYGEAVHGQLEQAKERHGQGDLAALLNGGDTWTVP
jgi:2-oxoglutarate ferredoxin oxidoreductase subunit beta